MLNVTRHITMHNELESMKLTKKQYICDKRCCTYKFQLSRSILEISSPKNLKHLSMYVRPCYVCFIFFFLFPLFTYSIRPFFLLKVLCFLFPHSVCNHSYSLSPLPLVTYPIPWNVLNKYWNKLIHFSLQRIASKFRVWKVIRFKFRFYISNAPC